MREIHVLIEYFRYSDFEKEGLIEIEKVLPKYMEVIAKPDYIPYYIEGFVLLIRDDTLLMNYGSIIATYEGLEFMDMQLTDSQKIAVISIIEKYYK